MNPFYLILIFGGASCIYYDRSASRYSSRSSSSSSEEHYYGGRGHGGRPHRPPHNHNNRNGACPRDWVASTRPSGGWCLKVFLARAISQTSAEAQCQMQGATLSGLQNALEISKVAPQALQLAPQGNYRLGARRAARCLRSGITASCTHLNSFEWTDGSTTGTDGFIWNTRQPDNKQYVQSCAALNVYNTPSVTTGLTPWYTERLDDVTCDGDIIGYVCGKAARRN